MPLPLPTSRSLWWLRAAAPGPPPASSHATLPPRSPSIKTGLYPSLPFSPSSPPLSTPWSPSRKLLSLPQLQPSSSSLDLPPRPLYCQAACVTVCSRRCSFHPQSFASPLPHISPHFAFPCRRPKLLSSPFSTPSTTPRHLRPHHQHCHFSFYMLLPALASSATRAPPPPMCSSRRHLPCIPWVTRVSFCLSPATAIPSLVGVAAMNKSP